MGAQEGSDLYMYSSLIECLSYFNKPEMLCNMHSNFITKKDKKIKYNIESRKSLIITPILQMKDSAGKQQSSKQTLVLLPLQCANCFPCLLVGFDDRM